MSENANGFERNLQYSVGKVMQLQLQRGSYLGHSSNDLVRWTYQCSARYRTGTVLNAIMLLCNAIQNITVACKSKQNNAHETIQYNPQMLADKKSSESF